MMATELGTHVAVTVLAAIHAFPPIPAGKSMYHQVPSKIAWFLTFVGFNVLYLPFLILGWEGMPRRYWDYLPQYTLWHQVATVGSWIMIAGILTMFINLIHSVKHGKVCKELDPWGGGRTLEWSVPSPPPLENFRDVPVVNRGPYDLEPHSEAK